MGIVNWKPQVGLAVLALVLTLHLSSDGQEIDFKRDIAPILESRCWSCHGEDEESGLRLDRRPNMIRGGDSGLPTIVPGEPERSYLLDVINHVDEDMAMPPDEDKLPAEEIELLTRWIQSGANWPGQMEAVAEEKSDHWSFQPVVRPELPIGGEDVNPVDAFLAKRLAENELTFSQSADPRTLIRRASIVLTGIAPTAEETEEFVVAFSKDPANEEAAYAALVERLLASPHFGERWAQHWLDVIRWAETNGSESNMYRKNAWIYRDYVIRAFNDDKPYDDFLFEQIAGDTVGQGEATGYLVSGSHVPASTVGSEPTAQRQARADRMDEVLQTVGASALGMTIGCARCHNHKFDPISIGDYYAMSAVFQGVEFGSRFPELQDDHPQKLREIELTKKLEDVRSELAEFGAWEENWQGFRDLHVPPTTVKKIRVTFLKKFVRLDEVEIFGPADPAKNLASVDYGTKPFTPPELEHPNGKAEKLNDGIRGVKGWRSQTPKGGNAKDSKKRPTFELEFAEPVEISRINLSTNIDDYYETDYLTETNLANFGNYTLEVADANGQWSTLAVTSELQNAKKQPADRTALMKKLNWFIQQMQADGPQSAFVAKFVEPTKTHILGRGSPENKRDEVFAAGLAELDGKLDIDPYAPGHERRKAFAQWLIQPTHPLTARVEANRIWHHVFGSGLVTTTSDFGAAGTLPTHPALLDWLAAELVQPTYTSKNPDEPAAWSPKHIIRMLVMSKAFRQSGLPNEKGLAVDADAFLLWRYPPKRVEAEVIRDSILQASGSLVRTVGGESYRIHNVKKRYAQWEVLDNHGKETWRRMIYQERMRRVDDQMFTAFDFPDCGQVRAKRPISTTPLQALNLMNSNFVMEQSKLIAERAEKDAAGDEAKSVERCFELLLGRAPSADERSTCVEIAKQNDLSLVCRALINSNEFAFIP